MCDGAALVVRKKQRNKNWPLLCKRASLPIHLLLLREWITEDLSTSMRTEIGRHQGNTHPARNHDGPTCSVRSQSLQAARTSEFRMVSNIHDTKWSNSDMKSILVSLNHRLDQYRGHTTTRAITNSNNRCLTHALPCLSSDRSIHPTTIWLTLFKAWIKSCDIWNDNVLLLGMWKKVLREHLKLD
jgi:hypothetical protein